MEQMLAGLSTRGYPAGLEWSESGSSGPLVRRASPQPYCPALSIEIPFSERAGFNPEQDRRDTAGIRYRGGEIVDRRKATLRRPTA